MLQTQHDATWKSCVSARMKYIKQVNCEKWDHRLLEFLLFNAISWVNQAWKNPKPNGAGCGGSVWYLWRQRWGEGWTCHQGKCQQNRWYMIEMLQYILILYLDHSGPYIGILLYSEKSVIWCNQGKKHQQQKQTERFVHGKDVAFSTKACLTAE